MHSEYAGDKRFCRSSCNLNDDSYSDYDCDCNYYCNYDYDYDRYYDYDCDYDCYFDNNVIMMVSRKYYCLVKQRLSFYFHKTKWQRSFDFYDILRFSSKFNKLEASKRI